MLPTRMSEHWTRSELCYWLKTFWCVAASSCWVESDRACSLTTVCYAVAWHPMRQSLWKHCKNWTGYCASCYYNMLEFFYACCSKRCADYESHSESEPEPPAASFPVTPSHTSKKLSAPPPSTPPLPTPSAMPRRTDDLPQLPKELSKVSLKLPVVHDLITYSWQMAETIAFVSHYITWYFVVIILIGNYMTF